MIHGEESWHRKLIEHRSALMAVVVTVGIAIGSVIEIVPMYTVAAGPDMSDTIEPYTPLELAGRDIYIREGCYNCHSQMIRPFRAETLRYGDWSRAGEVAWDRPFQLGSRRIGPDLARIGGKYPDAWHYEHMKDPRATTPGSVMPPYPWLLEDKITAEDVAATVQAHATLGAPYDDTSVAGVQKSIDDQAGEIVKSLSGSKITADKDDEIVALIAYLQKLGAS